MNALHKKKRAGIWPYLAALLVLLTVFCQENHAHCHYPQDRVLILYDSAGEYADTGLSNAILLRNLLGHFDVEITSKPVTEYREGEMDNKLATFYVGTTFNEPSYYDLTSTEYSRYQTFLEDAATTDATVVWMNYNLWLLDETLATLGSSLNEQYGFSYFAAENSGYNRVNYKNTVLNKGVVTFANVGSSLDGCTSEGGNTYACATELNKIIINDSSMVNTHATTFSTINEEAGEEPYMIQSDNLWFIGDVPFMYFSEEDRYLAFSDLLHEILETDASEKHYALLRLEDVGPGTDLEALKEITDYLETVNIPYSVATISYNYDGETWSRLSSSDIGSHLRRLSYNKYYRSKPNVTFVAHGKTHQSRFAANPYDAISGNDFEFYRVTMNSDNSLNFVSPLPEDSRSWAYKKMLGAYYELSRTGCKAFAWEAPHYTASSNSYYGIKNLYSIHYGRMTYFVDSQDSIQPTFLRCFWKHRHEPWYVTSLDMLGQFFPYPIYNDRYGYKIVPENIGYYEPEPFDGYRPLYPEDLIRHAEKALVVRDGYASFFYHPDLGVEGLQQIIEGIQNLGYEFIAADTIF